MAATTAQLTALARDGAFRIRIGALVLMEAENVYGESTGVSQHAQRAAYAIKLIQSPGLAEDLARVIVTRTNLLASNVSYDFDRGLIVTDATDGAIRSQIATDWNMLAGV